MSKRVKMWIAIIVFFLLLVAGSFYWFVQSINDDFEERHQPRVEEALQRTALEKVTAVHSYVSDRTYTVISGKDKQNERMYAWVGWKYLRTAYASEGVDANQVRQQLAARQPQANVLRITLGIYDLEPAWEVYFDDVNATGIQVKGYRYYRFTDGVELGSIQLTRRHNHDPLHDI